MTDLHTKKADEASGLSGQNFQAKTIGKSKTSQEQLSATQGRKASAQKQKKGRLLPYIIAVICIVVVGLVVWGLIAIILFASGQTGEADMPVAEGDTLDAAIDYSEELQKAYEQQEGNTSAKLGRVEEMTQQALDESSGERRENVRLALARFYFDSKMYTDALEALAEADLDAMTVEQRWGYWNIIYYANAALGNTGVAEEAGRKSYELRKELGGAGGGA